MAIYLFKLIRNKVREKQASKAIPTTDDSHLIPNMSPRHSQQEISCTKNVDVPISAEDAARHKEEARKRDIRQWKLMIGLALPNFLAAIDVTIVAPAIPLISSHFSTL